MKDQKIELPDVPFIFQYGQYDEDDLRQPDCRLIPYGDFQKIMQAYARTAIEPYAKRIAELEAARIAYASEFAPDEEGEPDIGLIHENIRKLKADRKHKGEVVVTKDDTGSIVAVTRQDDEGRILSVIAEADRQRRSEPVMYQVRTRPNWNDYWNRWEECTREQAEGYRRNPIVHDWHYEVRELFTAPQPAEPLMQEKISVDKSTYGWPSFKDACYQGDEPVKMPRDGEDQS